MLGLARSRDRKRYQSNPQCCLPGSRSPLTHTYARSRSNHRSLIAVVAIGIATGHHHPTPQYSLHSRQHHARTYVPRAPATRQSHLPTYAACLFERSRRRSSSVALLTCIQLIITAALLQIRTARQLCLFFATSVATTRTVVRYPSSERSARQGRI